MEQSIAEQKALELKIDKAQVVRESRELIALKGLYESPIGRYLIFKGGTALRLTYGSPRFSEDLDFFLTQDTLKKKFASLVKKIKALRELSKKFPPYVRSYLDDITKPFVKN